MSLRKMYAMGIQQDPSPPVVSLLNTNSCYQCIMENKIPKSVYYYGELCLTCYSIDGKNDVKYNCECSNGHLFVYGWKSNVINVISKMWLN